MSSDAGLSRISFASSSPPPSGRGPPRPELSAAAQGTAAKKRTGHACDRCRLMRTKCSGGTRCNRCTKDDAVCVYGDHKRERTKKDLADSVSRIKELEGDKRTLVSALRQMTLHPDFQPSQHVDAITLLAKYSEEDRAESPEESRSQSRGFQTPSINADMTADRKGELEASSTIGSPGGQGELIRSVDIDHGKGAAGFTGKMSEMSWMQRCQEYLSHPSVNSETDITQQELDRYAASTTDLAYFMDDSDLLSVDEDFINSLQWPPFQSGIIISEAYFRATQGEFQFISLESFVQAMFSFPQQTSISWDQRKWLALANLVWAIGAKWLELTKLGDEELCENHVVYYARARALGLDHRISYDHPDITMTQGIGLLAFYLLINGSISRAWNAVGNAIRHAMTLGLHLKVSDPAISTVEQEQRARIWFSLYKLQMHVAEITGRPQLVRTAHVTIPPEILERPPHGHMSNSDGVVDSDPVLKASKTWLDFMNLKGLIAHNDADTAFAVEDVPHLAAPVADEVYLYHIRLCQLSEEIADQLYTGRQDVSWSQTQHRIEKLQQGLDAWTGTLPEDLKVSSLLKSNRSARGSIQLMMHGCSVTMILYRPCLCEIQIDNQSQLSKAFDLSSARACVNAAISMLNIMPDEFVAHRVYQLLPWWALLHYLCQAASVLLLELCLDSQHFQGEARQIIGGLWKALAYLSHMAEESKSAYKAWRIFHELFQRVSARYGEPEMFDFSRQAVRPAQWSRVDEELLWRALRS